MTDIIALSPRNPEEIHNTLAEVFGEPIYSYSRAQAIEDGYLVDVTDTAHEAGITFPVAVTRRLWDEYITPDPRSVPYGQSIRGRLWDTLWMLRCAILMRRDATDRIRYKLAYIMKKRQYRTVVLKAVVDGGDDGSPVITIMLPDED